jgi:hypothetical protein
MKTLDHNAVSRSLHLVGYQFSRDMARKARAADAYKLAEVNLEYQIDLTGQAYPKNNGTSIDVPIVFQEVLYYAPLQRNIKTEDPHVTTGYQLDSGDVKLHVYVTQWTLDDSANYSGATVRIAAERFPWATGSAWAGTVHINFQGLGAPVEDPGYTETP